MINLEFLKNYPLSSDVIKNWFHKELLESLNDSDISGSFKEFVIKKGVELSKIASLIEINPRMLLDVFDHNEVYIQINVFDSFSYSINKGDVIEGSFENRRQAERSSVIQAFKILEEKLTSSVQEIVEE